MKIPVVIEITHVASAEPSIFGKDFVGFVWKIPVAGKDIRPACNDLADLVSIDALFFFERARFDANLHVRNGFSRGVQSR